MRTVRLGSRSAQHPLSRDRVSSPVSDESQRAERTTTMRTLRPMPAASVMVFRARAELGSFTLRLRWPRAQPEDAPQPEEFSDQADSPKPRALCAPARVVPPIAVTPAYAAG